MKKVGILTFHYADNCGAILQLIALRDLIKTMGYDVSILDYKSKALVKRNAIIQNPLSRFIYGWNSIEYGYIRKLKRGLGTVWGTFSNFFQMKELKESLTAFNEFRKQYINNDLSGYIEGIHELENVSSQLSIIIVGSDQVWNVELLGGIPDKVYFLDSKKIACKKISFAASAGGNLKLNAKDCKKYMNNFDVISVRENQLAEEIRKCTDKNIFVVCDPVFLLKKEQWMKFVGKNHYGKYILLYPIEGNREFVKIIDYLKGIYNDIKIIEFGNMKIYANAIKITNGTPDIFLTLLYHAELVVSSSFHATAFSCIFNKDFITLKHSTRNMRIEDLLKRLGLEKNMVNTIDDVRRMFPMTKRDDDNINEEIIDLRQEAISFLKSNLC